MGVIEDDAELVGGGVGEVVGGEFAEGGGEGFRGAGGLGGVGVGLELVFAGPGVGEDGEEFRGGLEQDGEKNQSGVGGDVRYPEGIVELAGEGALWIGGEADEEEDERHLEDADGEALADVAEAEMADLMGEDGEQLGGGGFFREGVEEGDFLVFPEAGEVGVGLGGALRSVDFIDAFERESAFDAEGMDRVLEGAVGHGGELVEERQDEGRGEIGEDELERGDKGPCPEPCVWDCIEDPEDAGGERQAEDGGESEAFDPVRNEGGGGGFVETEFLLDDEGLVPIEGQGDEVLREEQGGEEGESGDDRVFGKRAGQGVEEREAAEPPEGEQEGERDAGAEDVEAGIDREVGSGAV